MGVEGSSDVVTSSDGRMTIELGRVAGLPFRAEKNSLAQQRTPQGSSQATTTFRKGKELS